MTLAPPYRQLRLDPSPTELDVLINRLARVLPDPPLFGTPVGCSRATEQKHPIYLKTLRWLTTMHTPLVRGGAQFLCIETHAGPLWYRNTTTGLLTVGSPGIDLDVLDQHPLFAEQAYSAIFCELGKPRRIIQQLRLAIEHGGFGQQGTIEILDGDFARELPRQLDTLRGRYCGVLFADANGSIRRELIDIAAHPVLRKVDLVLWHQAHVRNRFLGLPPEQYAEGGRWHRHFERYDYRPLGDILPDLGKRRWLIRRPFNAGSNTAWTMLIGSNMPNLPEWRANEFYYLDSLIGQAILAECDGA